MLYSKSTQYVDVFANQVFQKFVDEVYGPFQRYGRSAYELSTLLHHRFTVDDFAYHDDMYYFGILNYMQTIIIPHKIAVYKAGMSLLENESISSKLSEDERDQFMENLIVHDLSKFSAEEVFGYSLYNRKTGSGKEGFEKAWHHHKMHNKHHPEYWLNPNRSGELEPLPMPTIYLLEMIADWMGAGETYGTSLVDWLPVNIGKFKFADQAKVAEMIRNATGINVIVWNGGLIVEK